MTGFTFGASLLTKEVYDTLPASLVFFAAQSTEEVATSRPCK